MIHIEGDYYITADARCYSLVQKRVAGADSKEPGKEYYVPLDSYHLTVSGVIGAYVKRVEREAVESRDMSLQEAIELFQQIEGRAEGMVRTLAKESCP